MTHQDQATYNLQTKASSSVTQILLTSLAMIAVGYLCFVRPAQQQMQILERQCNKLVIAVKKLQAKDETARHGLKLLTLLDQQSEKIADAEQALTRFSKLRERMMLEADEMVGAMAALEQLEDLRSEVAEHYQTLDLASHKLSEMAEVAALITATSDLATKTNGELATLGQQQADISNSVTKLSRQLLTLETQLNIRSNKLPQAEATLTEIDKLCDKLADEKDDVVEARQQLSALANLKQEVIKQAANVPAAEAALDQVWDLEAGLLQANNTLSKAKQLAVDMMLLEPVLDRLANTLKPTAEAARLSRREAVRSPKTRQTAAAVEAEFEAKSPWSNALHVFVALLGSAK